MKASYIITQNKINVKFQTGYYPLPGGVGGGSGDLSNYYTKNETYSKTEVDDIISDIPVVDTSNLVPYTGANKDVNIGAYYFESSAGFKKNGGTSSQYLMADGSVSTLPTDLAFKSDIDNLQIGGRNYYRKNSLISHYSGLVMQRNEVNFPDGLYIIGTPDNLGEFRIHNVITSNGWWTISWDMRGNQSVAVGVYVDICDLGIQRFNTTTDNTWKRFSLSVNVTNYGDGSIYNFIDFSQFSLADFYIKNIKIEQGNKATDWTPAPEDKQDRLQDITENIGIGKPDDSATEKLDVNGNIKATGFKTPTGTANQGLKANGDVFGLNTKADLVDGEVPATQLPSYVDDVLEFENLANLS